MQPFCKKVNKVISDFDINIHGLEDRTYEYQFEGSDSFFQLFEQDIIEGGNFKVNLALEKTSLLIRLKFNIDADLKLVCDRSLEEFVENFKIEEIHIYKFGEEAQEMSDEIEVLAFGTPKINVAELISDFILLSVPMKKLHPKYREEDDDYEDGKLIYIDPNIEIKENITDVDPRWAALFKLKNLEE
ncbi:DUF177 domain-containing protein [Lacihabitans sp. LS3-19]|nr:DUF177 domain-containing protein [Lacihabitans sp. LS3-19]